MMKVASQKTSQKGDPLILPPIGESPQVERSGFLAARE